jgi:class 3 adenylate cyclase
MFAATYPDQTSAVVTYGAHPATLRDDDYPWGSSPEQRDEVIAGLRDLTINPEVLLSLLAPSEADDLFMRRWWSTYYQSAISRSEAVDFIDAIGPVDIRGLLGSVRAPTLVLHRTGDRIADVGASRYMAQRLPNATFKQLSGEDHLPFVGDQDAVLGLVQEFLTGTAPEADADRVLATVLFTDIVDSTRLATELGDRRWHRLLAEHDRVVRSELARFRGREDKTTGDGFLASFDGPARAIRAADAIRAGLAEHGLQIRVGLHTGECEFVGGRIGGIAVHIAARILAQAQAAEILCSRTVKDLVAGAGFNFTDRGVHRLKGVQDEWQLYNVQLVRR